jgi:hypothetical protein
MCEQFLLEHGVADAFVRDRIRTHVKWNEASSQTEEFFSPLTHQRRNFFCVWYDLTLRGNRDMKLDFASSNGFPGCLRGFAIFFQLSAKNEVLV